VSSRREAREWALQLLFQLEVNPGDVSVAFNDFWSNTALWEDREAAPRNRVFAEELVRGVLEHRAELDEVLKTYLEHWDLGRLGVVERNVLRFALYEMRYRDDIPPVVTINEAVDVAKYFGTTECGRFVNGILDRYRKALDRPARTAARKARPAAE